MRYRIPCKTRFRLAARPCREGVEPSGTLRKVSDRYIIVPLSQIYPVASWSHARRYLFEALPYAPESRQGLDIILELFQVERSALNRAVMGKAEHLQLRQRRSVPIVATLRQWVDTQIPLHEPKSPMTKALGYIDRQWEPLTAFLKAPLIPIHNNASESALRIISLIRKNSMFFGNDAAAHRFMILHSLIATCDKHQVNPLEYLTDILIRIQDYPKSQVADLLPHRWKVLSGTPKPVTEV